MKNKYGIANAVVKDTLFYRQKIKADNIMLITDVQVKHAEMLDKHKSLQLSAQQAELHQSDGVILTGEWTAIPPTNKDLKIARNSVNIPVIIGSGATAENILELKSYSDAAIVGTYFKQGQNKSAKVEHNIKGYEQRVDRNRVAALINQVKPQS